MAYFFRHIKYSVRTYTTRMSGNVNGDTRGLYCRVKQKGVVARMKLWTFEMENKRLSGSGKLDGYLAVTYDVEQKVGGRFWGRIAGKALHSQKPRPLEMWSLGLAGLNDPTSRYLWASAAVLDAWFVAT